MSTSGTASPEEVARFAQIADEWWDDTGKFKPLHQINPCRIQFVRDAVAQHFERDPLSNKPLSGLDLVDLGCGGGLMSEPLCHLGANVTAIDAGDVTLGVAKSHGEQSGLDITYRQALPEDLLADGLKFDVVMSLEVVEHVADLDIYYQAVAGLLKPGGLLILSTINRNLKSLALAKIGAEYILRWVPAGTHDWNKFVTPNEMQTALQAQGLTRTTIKGMSYNPFKDSWSLNDDTDVNYLATFVQAEI